MSVQRPRFAAFLMGATAFLASACGASKTSTNPPPTGFGQLAIKVVDAPSDKSAQATEIWVTITQVTAHTAGDGWVAIPMVNPPVTLDLLKLQDSALDLGLLDLPEGTTVTQVRLYVDPAADNHVVLKDGASVPLKVPSGSQSGIKIHGPWEISECAETAVTLDFDGKKSIWYHPTGQGDLWILRPVVRVKRTETVPVGCVPPEPPPGPVACGPVSPACPEGDVCLGTPEQASCAGPPGATCTVGAECISGDCVQLECDSEGCQPRMRCGYSDAGEPCFADGHCLGNACDPVTNTCSPADGNGPCTGPSGCVSGVCGSDGSCVPPDGAGEGTTCESDGECDSGSCTAGQCDPSGQSYPCSDAQGCQDGLTCSAGACEPARAM